MIDAGRMVAPPVRKPSRGAAAGLASFLLGGLTSMEVLAVVVAFVSIVGLLWMTGSAAPERLVTSSWMRAGWALCVVAVLRPITWIPYAAVFVGLRRLVAAIGSRGRTLGRNAAAHALTLSVLGVAVALTFAAVRGAARWTSSALGFVMGTVDVAGLGHTAGRWDAARVLAAAGAFLLLRPVVPPVGLDLDLRARPVLWLVEGSRGRFDAWLLGAVCAAGLVIGAIAAIRA